MKNIWHDISPDRISPDDFIVVVEIPKGSKNKYELDKETGLMMLDRVLYTPRTIRQTTASSGTFADDGDPLDALSVLRPIAPMTLVRCYPIRGYKDDRQRRERRKGDSDTFRGPYVQFFQDISELPEHIFNEMGPLLHGLQDPEKQRGPPWTRSFGSEGRQAIIEQPWIHTISVLLIPPSRAGMS